MDLLKARERAKEKAREKEGKPAGQEEVQPAKGGAAAELPPQEKKEGKKKTAAPKKSAVSPPSARKEKERATEPAAAEKNAPSPPTPPPVSAGKEMASSLPSHEPEDVFDDTAFGEDLPPEVTTLPEEAMMLGYEEGEEKKERKEPVMTREVQLDLEPEEEITEEKPPQPTPVISEPTPEKKEVKQQAPRAETKPAPAVSRPLEPLAKKAEKTATAPSPAPPPAARNEKKKSSSPPRLAMDWEEEEKERGWELEKSEPEDDFFALVSEELYLREFGKASEEDSGEQLELLSFRLANETYAVHLVSIKQIIKLVPITLVPRAPAHVLGIISLRGNIIPVFDLRKVLHLPQAPPSRKSRIMIVSHGKYTAGLIVDEVEQVVRLPHSRLEPPPPVLAGVEAEYLEGIGRVGPKMIILLSLEKIMVPIKP